MYAMVSNIILLHIAVISICGSHAVCILSIVTIVTSSVYFLFLLLLPPVCLYPFMSSITLCNYKCLHCILKERLFFSLSKGPLHIEF